MSRIETRYAIHMTHEQMELTRDALEILQEKPYLLTEDEDLLEYFERLAFETACDLRMAQIMEHDPIEVENLNYDTPEGVIEA
jgi:hypothetical protein